MLSGTIPIIWTGRAYTEGVLQRLDFVQRPQEVFQMNRVRVPWGAFAIRCSLLLVAALTVWPKVWGQERAYVDAESYPASIATVAGKFVYVATGGDARSSGDVCAYRINPQSGLLTPIGKWAAAKTNVANLVVADPKNRFVYAGGGPYQPIEEFSVDPSSGALSPVGELMVGSQVRQIGMDPNGNFAYVITVVNSVTTIISYRIENSGALTEVGTPLPIGKLTPPAGMTIDPRGRLAYIVNDTSVASLRIDPATGAISILGGMNDPPNTDFSSAAISPNGRYLLLVDGDLGFVQSLAINSDTGAFALVGKPVPLSGAVGNPETVTFDPSGRHVYVTAAGIISVYAMNENTGELELIGGMLPTFGAADRMAIDQTGKFLYAVGNGIRTVFGYRIDGATGEFTRLGTPEMTAFAAPGTQAWVTQLIANRGGATLDTNLVPPASQPGNPVEWTYGTDPSQPTDIHAKDVQYHYLGYVTQSSLLLSQQDGHVYRTDNHYVVLVAARVRDIPISLLKTVTNPSPELRDTFLKAEDHGENAHLAKGPGGKYTLSYRQVQGGTPGPRLSYTVVKMPASRVNLVVPVGLSTNLWIWLNDEGKPTLPLVFDLQPQGFVTWIPVPPEVARQLVQPGP